MNSEAALHKSKETQQGNEIMVWGDNKFGQLGIGPKLTGFDFPNVSTPKISLIYSPNFVCFRLALSKFLVGLTILCF